MMKSRLIYVLGLLLGIGLLNVAGDNVVDIDDTKEAKKYLEEQRNLTLDRLRDNPNAEGIKKLIELGSWDDANKFLDTDEDRSDSAEYKVVEAQLLIKQHQYQKAQKIVKELLEANSDNPEANRLQAELDIQAWRLDEADQIAKQLLEGYSDNPDAGIIRGTVALLQQDYERAMEWAKRVQKWDDERAAGYVLASEVHFWLQQPDQAKASLRKALERNPFDADARYYYGYAIWREGDATQLPDMANQWNFALEINPQHYLTHWHFGNGHTHLTYADYTHSTDSSVSKELLKSDSLLAAGKVSEAIKRTHKIEQEYPKSVHPAMTRGSIFYMAYDMDRKPRLDSAEVAFEQALDHKKNYGPAHNGLAAVIKQRQFEQLEEFKALQDSITQTSVPDSGSVFYDVFPDASYYPGDRVTKMIAQQIGPSKAYLPMINKFGSDFAIPPLHVDLAEAMDNNFFRYGTTFDNRQWMDIRGVGSGATGIEYLERGAHLERNVLAHEYAHLYHGRILTDREDRRIRALYHKAMENDRTLDYYAANNESEFFAQGYAGMLSGQKVHPLNHKSMNTREYIREQDPDFYHFLDSLLTKQQEYLDGNEEVFNNNWAQTYLALSQSSSDSSVAKAHLDTSLAYSPDYIPAILEYAEWEAKKGDFERAFEKINESRSLDPQYGPVYMSEAEIIHLQVLKRKKSFEVAITEIDSLYKKVDRLETDLAERAVLNTTQRERYLEYGKLVKAVEATNAYVDSARAISTYLEDQKEQAEAFYYKLRSSLGYSEESATYFKSLIEQNPQNFQYRLMYVDVLIEAGRENEASSVLIEGQRILDSAENERDDYQLRAAEVYLLREQNKNAQEKLSAIEFNDLSVEEALRGAQLWIALNDFEAAEEIIEQVNIVFPSEQAEFAYTKGKIAQAKDNHKKAKKAFQKALSITSFHLEARLELVFVLEQLGESDRSMNIEAASDSLAIPLGPDFEKKLTARNY
ncbi:MAG: tetratricopeptide repeat protein [Bacteroidota bacterium]